MSFIRQEVESPDKYDRFIAKFDVFQSMVEDKKRLQTELTHIKSEYFERIKPLEDELASVIKKLEANLPKLDGVISVSQEPASGQKFSRGQLGVAIKDLLRSNPEKSFKPREIAEALDTKGTSVSLWFNKYGLGDNEIERVPVGEEGKRFVYRIRQY